ncbi:hypothetical protein DRO55_00670 [Candidatus Bathyarchaeota archaeon]|nr:MAG: hypothetical protein DRO55_00670 [Candidatus Bathyarchaeota archaeon]
MKRMLKKIRVTPLAFESLGVRSMCTYVETPDVRILLDAGVSLGPRRFGLPPHPREYQALRSCRERILNYAEKADVITVSHYHFDHHTPSYTDWAYNWSSAEIAEKIYRGKILFIKSYRSMVNFSQRRRGWMFLQTGGSHAERIEVADNRSFRFGDTKISFSEPVFHGSENSPLGWVIMATITHNGERLLFAPDVQGPISNRTLQIILSERPNLLILGGPPIYLADYRVKSENIQSAMRNIRKIAEEIPTTILDHHLLRDEGWRRLVEPAYETASRIGHKILTAADFIGEENRLLEARRSRLYEEEPPSREFMKWARQHPRRRKTVKPPI